jgi:drug/metabolite transporter (DMT)-like permease
VRFVRDVRSGTGSRGTALAALATAGIVWGLTVPLSKLALAWLGPAWLTVGRFAVAAPVLALVARPRLRSAVGPSLALWGALGYGAVILVQNAGIERTSVSHAALIVGVVPVLVAVMTASAGRGATGPVAWLGFALALSGVGLVAGGGGGSASVVGDVLVLVSVTLSSAAISVQPRLLAGRDPVAVTAVQFAGGALLALPAALACEGLPPAPPVGGWALPAAVCLATAGTLLPFTLFAFGQARVAPELAGAFVNLEPLVGALAGAAAFGDRFGPAQLAGGLVLVTGIALSAVPRREAAGAGESRPAQPSGAGRPTAPGLDRALRRHSQPGPPRVGVRAGEPGHRRVHARRERPPSPRMVDDHPTRTRRSTRTSSSCAPVRRTPLLVAETSPSVQRAATRRAIRGRGRDSCWRGSGCPGACAREQSMPGVIMAKATLGNHSALRVPRTERDRIRRFCRDVLGCEIARESEQKDDVRMGDGFYIAFLCEDDDVALDEGGFLKAIYLELKADDVEEMRGNVVAFGVKVLEVPDPHLYFQAPGGQVFRLVGTGEDLSRYEGTEHGEQCVGELFASVGGDTEVVSGETETVL